jgi:nitroreductase
MTETGTKNKAPLRPPHNVNDALAAVKVRLQFTGWLQYILGGVATAVFGLITLIVWAVGAPLVVVWIPGAITAALLASLVFDIVVIKLGLRPPEHIPPARGHLDAFDLMRSRRSCRSFQPRDLTDEHRAALMTAVRNNTRPANQIGSSPIRFEYAAAPLTVWPVVGAHEFLVAIAPKAYDRMAVIDVGRSLQKVVLEATRMGVATCWIGPGADHESIVSHLGERFDPDKDHIICVCAVGYESRFKPTFIRMMQRGQHRRLPLGKLFFADADLSQRLDIDHPPFAEFGRCYEVCQWSPSSFNGQPTRCVGVTDTKGRAARFDFYSAKASRFYSPVALGIWCANWETGCEALGFRGHFEVLGERGGSDPREVPHYDVSWVVERR